MKELRKLWKEILVLAVLLIALAVVLIVRIVEQYNIDKLEQSHIVDICSDMEIQSVAISGKDGEESVYQYGPSFRLKSVTYNGQEFSQNNLNESEIRNKVTALIHFTISKRFEATDADRAAYGLEQPMYLITITKNDNSQKVMRVGNILEDKSGIYVMVEGEKDVLIAEYSFYQKLSSRFENLLDRYVINVDRSAVDELEFTRASNGARWSIRPQPDYDNGLFLEPRYLVTYPMEREPKVELTQLFNYLIKLQVSQYVPIPEENYAEYGLDHPEYHISYHMKTGEVVDVFLSMEIGGYYYGYCSNSTYTFCIDPSTLPGLNTSPFELIDSYVIHGYLNDVRTATVTIGETTFILDVHLDDSMSFESEETTIRLDQRNAKIYTRDGDCYGLLLFGSIFQMPVKRVDYDVKPELADVKATIKVVKNDSENFTLKLVPCGEEEYYCFLNDRYSGFIVDRSVLYKDNGHNMSGFGIWDAYQLTNEAIDNKDINDVYDRP
ncbi:MAG: DUF4340 domain-containing protein [Clostridiales bacterium]|nr:DUF4340 domain-containing protein [Clostridiales bacterium]